MDISPKIKQKLLCRKIENNHQQIVVIKTHSSTKLFRNSLMKIDNSLGHPSYPFAGSAAITQNNRFLCQYTFVLVIDHDTAKNQEESTHAGTQ
jgi:hypothetical protein